MMNRPGNSAARVFALVLLTSLSRLLMSSTLVLLSLNVPFVEAATKETMREVKFKEFPFEITRGERLVVQGLRGHIRLVPTAAGKPSLLRARKTLPDATKSGARSHFDELSFSVRRESGVVIIEPKGPSSRQDWIDWSGAGQPDLSFEIEAPATSAEIHLHSGSITAAGWKDQLLVSLQEGKISSTDGDGIFRATILRGEIRLDKQKGAVEIESHSAKVNISNGDGNIRVHNFSGETTVNGVKGEVSVRSKAGLVNISKIEGGLDFDNGRGRFEAIGIDGAVRGLNDDGTVSIQLAGEADVSVETLDGSVTIKPPGGAGVLLKLSSEDGAIVAPDSVNIPKVSGPKSVVARLDGAPKGVIAVRSKRGTIRVR
jgi:hypothetical protein